MRFVAYLRVSTEAQVDGYGLDAQEDACRAYAERHGHEVVAVLRDEGVSGRAPAHDRPGLTGALLLLRDGDADALLVARLDRLARQLTVQEAVLAEAWRYDATVHAADAGEVAADDPDDPMRTFVRQVMGAVAELDRALTVKRMLDGRRAKKARGGKGEGRYPYGSSRQGPVPAERRVLAHVHALRAAGLPWDAIASDLNERALPPRHAERWSARNVSKVAGRR